MSPLTPLDVIFDPVCGDDLPLPDDIRRLYGRLQFPAGGTVPRVIGNFVTTLDGVVSLGVAGTTDGDAISGSNEHDSMVMGLLRSASDAVIVGAGTMRQSPNHLWTPEFVFPPLAASYRRLRSALGKSGAPSTVIVSAGGPFDFSLPVFTKKTAPVVVVTTEGGVEKIGENPVPPGVRVVAAGKGDALPVGSILDAVERALPGGRMFLIEGGPRLIGQFFDDGRLDELFLTLSPRLAGRDDRTIRLGLIAGRTFLPGRIVSGTLRGVRKSGSHVFLRYGFTRGEE